MVHWINIAFKLLCHYIFLISFKFIISVHNMNTVSSVRIHFFQCAVLFIFGSLSIIFCGVFYA